METPLVTLSLKELVDIRDSLGRLLNAPLKIRASYRATKFSKKIVKELEDLDKARKELIIRYGERMDADGNFKVKKENTEAFQKEYDSLLEETVELPVMKLTLEEIEVAGLTMLDVANLEFMIEEPKNIELIAK